MRIHHVIFTSTQNQGYKITAKSINLPKYLIREIEEKSLFKGMFPPDIEYLEAIKKFECGQLVCISYITFAGSDEYGRRGRLRGHIFLLSRRIARLIFDFRAFYKFFIKEDVEGKLDPIELNAEWLYHELKRLERRVLSISKIIIKKFSDEGIIELIKNSLLRNHIIVYPPRDTELLRIYLPNKISSADVISFLLFILPETFRTFINFTTLAFVDDKDVNISFIWPPAERIELKVLQGSKSSFMKEKRVEKFSTFLYQMFVEDLERFKQLRSLINVYLDAIGQIDADKINKALSISKVIYEGLLE